MRVLVLNCGSSTLKFQLIDTDAAPASECDLARGVIERIGRQASLDFQAGSNTYQDTAVAYLLAADNVSGPLPSRLREVNQPVIITRNGCSRPRPRLLPCI
jgi:hypothetical protein